MSKNVAAFLRSKAEEFVGQLDYEMTPAEKEKAVLAVTETIKSTIRAAFSSRVLKEIDVLEAAGQEFDVEVYLSVREPKGLDILRLGLQRALSRLRGEKPETNGIKQVAASSLGKLIGAFLTRYVVTPRLRRSGHIR